MRMILTNAACRRSGILGLLVAALGPWKKTQERTSRRKSSGVGVLRWALRLAGRPECVDHAHAHVRNTSPNEIQV